MRELDSSRCQNVSSVYGFSLHLRPTDPFALQTPLRAEAAHALDNWAVFIWKTRNTRGLRDYGLMKGCRLEAAICGAQAFAEAISDYVTYVIR